MKHIAAIAAAAAVSAVSFMAIPASAADVSIAYSESAGSKATSDDGKYLRRNIYNVWGNEVTDINGATAVNDYVKVTFEVSGIGSDSQLVKEDDTTEQLKVFLGGSIAGVSYHWNEYKNGSIPGSQVVDINGDGQYTVTWENVYSENIDCLYLQSNINFYAYGDNVEDVNGSNANIKVVSIVTGEAASNDSSSTADSSSQADSSKADSSTASSSTASSSSAASSSAASSSAAGGTSSTESTSNTSTGDSGVAAFAIAGLTAAGAAVLVSRKKKD